MTTGTAVRSAGETIVPEELAIGIHGGAQATVAIREAPDERRRSTRPPAA